MLLHIATYLPEDVTALLTTSKPPSLNDGSSSDVEDQLDELMWNASTHPEALQDPSIEIASYKMGEIIVNDLQCICAHLLTLFR